MSDETRDFLSEIEFYELPTSAPKQVEGEVREYYRHPAGTYIGFIGKLVAKFKDLQGKRCEADEPGATFSHYILSLWIKKYLGNPQNPIGEQIITDDLKLPDRPLAEIYFPITLFPDPKRQWSNKLMFDKWKIAGHEKYNIIQVSPTNPSNTVTNYQGFPAYYGLPCKFSLTFKADSEKQSRYIDGAIEILDYTKRIPKDLLAKFEEDVEKKVEEERKERQSRNESSGYVPPAKPSTDFDSFLSGDGYNNDVDDSLDEFLK